MPFSFFQNPVDWSHIAFERFAVPGSSVIDATVGNGYDTLFLAKRVLQEDEGKLFAFDIQEKALMQAKERLQQEVPHLFPKIRFFHQSHETFPEEIEKASIALIVYNLGYLPGGDKEIVSKVESTLKSIKNGLPLLKPGGALSLTCYPGHSEGKREEEALLLLAAELPQALFQATHTRWLNRKESPSHLLIQFRG